MLNMASHIGVKGWLVFQQLTPCFYTTNCIGFVILLVCLAMDCFGHILAVHSVMSEIKLTGITLSYPSCKAIYYTVDKIPLHYVEIHSASFVFHGIKVLYLVSFWITLLLQQLLTGKEFTENVFSD